MNLKRISWKPFIVIAGAIVLSLMTATLIAWDLQVREQFEGRRWQIPSRVYGRSLELYSGAAVDISHFYRELVRTGYRETQAPQQPGQFSRSAGTIKVFTRGFTYWDGAVEPRELTVRFSGGRITEITDPEGRALDLIRFEPPLIGHIYPALKELRKLVRLDDLPDFLVQALILVEDREFYSHLGVDPRGILRALWVNLKAGEVVQGGSTLTQQLVKNMYLTAERSLVRKAREAFMALLLELHYSKKEIMEAYVNEVFLGQSRAGAIHGVGLASLHYFGTDAKALTLEQAALLVAMIKGPSYYDPIRHPERTLERRNLVLDQLRSQGIISDEDWTKAIRSPLGVTPSGAKTYKTYPAFLELVMQHLHATYPPDELQTAGLQIFSTFDPDVQESAEKSLQRFLANRPKLEGAMVAAHPQTGEILAVVGGKDPRYAGFNRALTAKRPIGSLVKPFITLAALERGDTLGTVLDDSPISVSIANQPDWNPENYDGTSHGKVPLIHALAKSYNQAFVRLGLDIGVENVAKVLERVVGRSFPTTNPSLLLGAIEATPLEVLTAYQVLASGGFGMRPQAVRAVLTPYGEPLDRFEHTLDPIMDPTDAYLMQAALHTVMIKGTGAAAYRQLIGGPIVGGKTGTTNSNRDSWFAGFGSDVMSVVWIGRDDNQPTKLTGSSGALRVWSQFMADLVPGDLNLQPPSGVIYTPINFESGERTGSTCPNAFPTPFREGTVPEATDSCYNPMEPVVGWFKRLLKGESREGP